VVWLDGSGTSTAAVLMCMGLDAANASNAIWVEMVAIVADMAATAPGPQFDLNSYLTLRPTAATIP
jgi:hypothetical protein